MSCANKAASEAAARMRVAGEQATQDSVAGGSSPAAANEQPATSNVTGARGHRRAVYSSAVSAAGGSPMDVDPENRGSLFGRVGLPVRLKVSRKAQP